MFWALTSACAQVLRNWCNWILGSQLGVVVAAASLRVSLADLVDQAALPVLGLVVEDDCTLCGNAIMLCKDSVDLCAPSARAHAAACF